MVLHGIALYVMVSHSFHVIPLYHMVMHGIVLHISYGIAWYCIVGFGARAVSRKTPIYFIIYIYIFPYSLPTREFALT